MTVKVRHRATSSTSRSLLEESGLATQPLLTACGDDEHSAASKMTGELNVLI